MLGKDACGLTAVVSSWYGSDASILKAIASPVISDQQLRRCLVAPGEDACLAAAMWPTFYTHTLQSCPEGWTMTAMGVCHNPALPWRCPTGWTRLALPPFCSPNGLESESIPSLKCYAVGYADSSGSVLPVACMRVDGTFATLPAVVRLSSYPPPAAQDDLVRSG